MIPERITPSFVLASILLLFALLKKNPAQVWLAMPTRHLPFRLFWASHSRLSTESGPSLMDRKPRPWKSSANSELFHMGSWCFRVINMTEIKRIIPKTTVTVGSNSHSHETRTYNFMDPLWPWIVQLLTSRRRFVMAAATRSMVFEMLLDAFNPLRSIFVFNPDARGRIPSGTSRKATLTLYSKSSCG